MAVTVIGGSASGIYYALLTKKAHPAFEVTIIEKEKKLARKVYATGNGHCNILSKDIKPTDFNHPEILQPLLEEFPFGELKKTLEGFGILVGEMKNGIYPLTYSASSTVATLESALKKAGVKVRLLEKFLDYELKGDGFDIKTDRGRYHTDILVFATGGASSPKLGSDGNLFPIFKAHGYRIEELRPGLCPMKVKEPYPKLDGLRHEAKLKVLDGKETIYEEVGEVLFRKFGLSGIAIFNAVSAIERKNLKEATISLDFFPDYDNSDMQDKLFEGRKIIGKRFLYSFFEEPLANLLIKESGFDYDRPDAPDFINLARLIKNFRLQYLAPEGFGSSQVSLGGVSLQNLDGNFESLIEKGVFFIGECVDIDGFCGGYNLTWALLSAIKASQRAF